MRVEITEITRNDYGFKEIFAFELKTPKHRISEYNMNECPEDATLYRDLSFVYSIENIIREAYNAGKSGEELEITTKEVEDE